MVPLIFICFGYLGHCGFRAVKLNSHLADSAPTIDANNANITISTIRNILNAEITKVYRFFVVEKINKLIFIESTFLYTHKCASFYRSR